MAKTDRRRRRAKVPHRVLARLARRKHVEAARAVGEVASLARSMAGQDSGRLRLGNVHHCDPVGPFLLNATRAAGFVTWRGWDPAVENLHRGHASKHVLWTE